MQDIENKQYIQHITKLGEKHTIVASEDIQNSKGIKLVNSGTRVDSSFYEKILKHKLLKPIEQSLNIKDCLTPSSLKERAAQAIEKNILLKDMKENSAEGELLSSIFSSLEIPEVLLFKLTVAEKQMPLLFNHCLNVAIASVYIAIELKQDIKSLKNNSMKMIANKYIHIPLSLA